MNECTHALVLARSIAALQALLQKFRGPVVGRRVLPSASSASALHFYLIAPVPPVPPVAYPSLARPAPPSPLVAGLSPRSDVTGCGRRCCWAAGPVGALETA